MQSAFFVALLQVATSCCGCTAFAFNNKTAVAAASNAVAAFTSKQQPPEKCNRVCVRYFFAGFASPKKIKIFFVALFRLQQFIAIAQHTLFTHNRAVRIYFNVSGFSILPKFICLLTVLFIK
jgi:hypothetical protein